MNEFDERMIKQHRGMVVEFDATNPVLREIVATISSSAAQKAISAGYNGAMDDGGASADIIALNAFLDGVTFATTGVTKNYKDINKEVHNRLDKDYKKYLELKAKFA